MSLLVLSGSDVDQVVSHFGLNELVDLMAQVFLAFPRPGNAFYEKNLYVPERMRVLSWNHHTLFMPVRAADLGGSAVKIVSVPSESAPEDIKERGLPASTMVLDETTGEVAAVVNACKLTALRNAASSLLATRLLGPKTPQRILAIGAGAQIAAHLSLFLSQYPSITSCEVFNRTYNARMQGLISDLGSKFAGRVLIYGHTLYAENGTPNPDLERLVREADIIITATSSTTPLFPSAYVKPGAHLCLIGSYRPVMHEIDTDLVKRAGRVVVDYRAGALSEAGELISAGLKQDDVFELGELISHPDVMRLARGWVPDKAVIETARSGGDVTIFKSVGVSVQDIAIANAVVQKAKQLGVGTVVEGYQ
ncbi:ornithine cyclodeaminase family protein [Phanerochaete sordida]|uniref:Ornithine cyclodeaminase family protein n=1 Tax=Phanerochaete sordida TaxID=48140 RepID=A0A9P3GH89_9APHY|nr:ornithine cyclodeaminase family protein [Phanerochaete sordida]